MEQRVVFKEKRVEATIQLPCSKSISNRLLIINALAGSGMNPVNLSDSDDTRILQEALAGDLSRVDVGHAGTAMRFLTAYLCRVPGEHLLTGSERMQRRPIKVLVDALRELGARIEYMGQDGFPPLRIIGTALQGKTLQVDASVSSQYISALMMIAPYLPGGLTLTWKGEMVSFPYVRMTARLMRHCGADVRVYKNSIRVRESAYSRAFDAGEPDWSAASYFYELLAVAGAGRVFLPGLRADSVQGDREQVVLWERLGVRSVFAKGGLTLNPCPVTCRSFEADFTGMPDVALSFIVACCLKDIPFRVSGLRTLHVKECDRVHAVVHELAKLGYILQEETDDVLIWTGERNAPVSLVIDTYDDHRMAMSFVAAAFNFPGLIIRDPGVVTKSFPRFWEQLQLFNVINN
ncbi:MAG: 3-phosphoshikimate 1-carboxyvinyltransferase [Marinifilaceae bacterium]|nr:3-phosphoshikimate 1-carboxyvinyltransferase [Marinifilaceae bacterium]